MINKIQLNLIYPPEGSSCLPKGTVSVRGKRCIGSSDSTFPVVWGVSRHAKTADYQSFFILFVSKCALARIHTGSLIVIQPDSWHDSYINVCLICIWVSLSVGGPVCRLYQHHQGSWYCSKPLLLQLHLTHTHTQTFSQREGRLLLRQGADQPCFLSLIPNTAAKAHREVNRSSIF